MRPKVDGMILLIGGNEQTISQLKQALELNICTPYLCTDMKSALEVLSIVEYQLVVIDFKLLEEIELISNSFKPINSKTNVISFCYDENFNNCYFNSLYESKWAKSFIDRVKNIILTCLRKRKKSHFCKQ